MTDLRSIAVQGLVDAGSSAADRGGQGRAAIGTLRHRFCPNCGAPTQVTQGGWRRDCAQCKAQHFPRTDPVVIMLASDGERCLLGRSPRFVPTMWSCLAGFVEPGEAIEDAVRRETREEAGIVCGRVRYFASQPWPFPMSLMIGCHAEALTQEIIVDRDELEDARWFDRDEIVAMLTRKHPDGLTTPPPVAIAHHIIRAWVEGESGFDWHDPEKWEPVFGKDHARRNRHQDSVRRHRGAGHRDAGRAFPGARRQSVGVGLHHHRRRLRRQRGAWRSRASAARARFAGPLGGADDAISERIVADLAAEGVDCSGVERVDRRQRVGLAHPARRRRRKDHRDAARRMGSTARCRAMPPLWSRRPTRF